MTAFQVRLAAPPAVPPICPVTPGLVRFGGVIMDTDRARKIAATIVAAAIVADDTPAAPAATATSTDAVRVWLYGQPVALTTADALTLVAELQAALLVAAVLAEGGAS